MSKIRKHLQQAIEAELKKSAVFNLVSSCSNISSDQSLSIEEILQHPELPWDMDAVSDRDDINIGHLVRYIEWGWNWPSVTTKIPARLIIEHKQLPWDFSLHDFNEKLLETYPNHKWNWSHLTAVAPLRFMEKNSEWPWNSHIATARFVEFWQKPIKSTLN